MSQTAAHEVRSKHAPRPVARGVTFSGLMVAMWSVFVTLLVVSPETLDDAYDWLTGLPIVWEILMWIVLLPWALAYLVLGELVGSMAPRPRRRSDGRGAPDPLRAATRALKSEWPVPPSPARARVSDCATEEGNARQGARPH